MKLSQFLPNLLIGLVGFGLLSLLDLLLKWRVDWFPNTVTLLVMVALWTAWDSFKSWKTSKQVDPSLRL
jgi:hypothetical protein